MKGALVFAIFYAALVGLAYAKDALFHVEMIKPAFDDVLREYGPALDIWSLEQSNHNSMIQAKIYASETIMHEIKQKLTKRRSFLLISSKITKSDVDVSEQVSNAVEKDIQCRQEHSSYLQVLNSETSEVTASGFFNCFRTANEVFAFFDQLSALNPNLLTKIDQVAQTFEGHSIPAYKLSSSSTTTSTSSTPTKKAIYTQGLIHAREWHAGSAVFYSMAAFVDALKSKDVAIQQIFEEYDWYFVPIVNIDGYNYTWQPKGRLWRKNRRVLQAPLASTGQMRQTYGVDLNRNFGPVEYFNKAQEDVWGNTYPGASVLSEPETFGIYQWLKTIPHLVGAVDVHAFGGQVLRPFANQEEDAAEPFGSRLKTLGDQVRDALMENNENEYISKPANGLYLAYGTFADCIFMEFNQTAALSLEIEGDDFIQPPSIIRSSGQHIFDGLKQFANSLTQYYQGL